MSKNRFFALPLAMVLLFSTVLVVGAVPPLPTTLYGKVQEGGADVSDGTSVSAWLGSTEAVIPGTPIAFPGTGVSITFSTGCGGDVTVSYRVGETQVVSQDGYTSVYALDALGPSNWIPPDDPETEGLAMTLKISDTVGADTTWSMGAVVPLSLTVESLVGGLPYSPPNVEILDQIWDISIDCTGYTADVTFTYDESLLGGTAEGSIVGMARYDADYSAWEYVAGALDTDANTVTVAGVTAFSRWRLLASAPPEVVGDLVASKSGSDLVLDWTAVTQDITGQAISGVTYNVYRAADDPYFAPGTPYDTTSGTTYTDSGAVGAPGTNYYYVVSAVDTGGGESAPSERVGEFDFTLYETTGTDYTWIGLPLQNSSLLMASDLEQHIEANCSASLSALSIARWNAPGQQIDQYTTVPIPIGDFALEPGQAYRVASDVDGVSSCVWTLTGAVPPRGLTSFDLVTTTGTDYTWIALPLDQGHLAMASDLEAAIESASTVDVLSVCTWNAAGQQIACYTTVPIPIGDFAIAGGHPYRVVVSAPVSWP